VAAPTLLDAVVAAAAARSRGESVRADLPPGVCPFVISCMDPRLAGTLLPALGLDGFPVPQAKFAGGIVRPGDVSGVRSVLAAAIFNMATEVLVVGHTDCRMGRTSQMEIRNGLARLGIRPEAFQGEDPPAWLGSFSSERQAVIGSVEALRADSRMPASLPIHGLLYHLETRTVEVLLRGYGAQGTAAAGPVSSLAGGAGPVRLGATPPPPAPAYGSTAGMTRGPVSFASMQGMVSGPVVFGSPGSVGGPPAPPPLVPPGLAPPPPLPSPPPSFAAPPPLAAPPPAEPVAEEAHPVPPAGPDAPLPRKKKARPGASPFDRARETLDRLRRDREP
jgi:carbonic anhydrase